MHETHDNANRLPFSLSDGSGLPSVMNSDCKNKIMRALTIIFVLLLSLNSYAQTPKVQAAKVSDCEHKVDSLMAQIDTLIMVNKLLLEQTEIDLSLKNRYKLYQTENIYTLLLLDTKTGRIDQVQWSLERSNEGSVSINRVDLSFGLGYGSNSFELYPTKNMYQFILLDKTDGRKWHVQWGMEESKRWIRRIF